MNKVPASVLTIFAATALVVTGTTAYFSDTERASGNTFAAGVIDLLVDNESYYNGNKCADVNDDPLVEDWQWIGEAAYPVPGSPCTTSWNVDNLSNGHLFFDFTDLKPDDEGEDTISLHADGNDAWACMNIALTSNDDASSTEPELLTGDLAEDPNNAWDGELAQNLEFIWWADDGDNVLEEGENLLSDGVETLFDLASSTGPFTAALADSQTNVWGEQGPIPGNSTRYIGKAWCLGTLTEARVTQDALGNEGNNGPQARGTGVLCDGTLLGNELQTDRTTLDVSFFTVQARHDSEYVCPEPPRIVACEIEQTYADEVIFVDQGLQKNGAAVSTAPGNDRSNTSFALGAPQSLGTPYDSPVIANSFFSLGFPMGDNTAEIVLSFNDNYIVNATGSDLKLWEVTGGTSYPDEQVDVYVGDTPAGPWTLVGDNVTRDAEIDIAPVVAARYVRIVDASDINLFEPGADGFDLDAVQALNCVQSPIR